MRIPIHVPLTDEELRAMSPDDSWHLRSLALSYKALREHHVLEVAELTHRLNRALYLANGYLTEIECEVPSAYDYEQERCNLDALLPPGAVRP